MNKTIIIYNLQNNPVITIPANLPSFILNKVHNEFANLINDCYYPKISNIYRELLFITNSNEDIIEDYIKTKYLPYKKYKDLKWKVLYNTYNNLLILIIQTFLKQRNIAASLSTFHLLALKFYSALMYKYIKFCNPEYFRTTLNSLSHNHIFVVKKTIPMAIMHLSTAVFQKYQKAIEKDDPETLIKMIYELGHRINQSMRSFYNHYYTISKEKTQTKTTDETSLNTSEELNLKQFIDKISKDICLYKKISEPAYEQALRLTKFNKELARKYITTITDPKYIDDINNLLYILLRDIKNLNSVQTPEFLYYIKKLMAVKVSKKEVYYKKILSKIHDQIIKDLHYEKWFNTVSIQTRFISRSFLSYYFAFLLREYIG